MPRAVKDKPTSKSWKMDKLQEELQRTHTGELMLMNLMPHAAYSRSVKVYGQVIMKYPMRKFSRADVYNISGHCNDGMTGSFNKHAVLKEMVTERLLDLQDIVEALLEHIKVIYLVSCLSTCCTFYGTGRAGEKRSLSMTLMSIINITYPSNTRTIHSL